MTAVLPEQLAKAGTEHAHQCALFCWAAMNAHRDDRLNEMFAVPNGGLRHKVIASRIKAEGARAGVPDLFLSVPKYSPFPPHYIQYCGFYIEMKKPGLENHKNGGCSVDQVKWHERLRKRNYLVETHYSWLTAATAIVNYLN